MRKVNACLELERFFPQKEFSFERWQRYIDSILPGSAKLFLDDIRRYDFDRQCLPIIREALENTKKRAETIASFEAVTNCLNEKINAVFKVDLKTEVILYLGLTNAAGWVEEIEGKTVVLLGIEKIIELGWYSNEAMIGLIYHELGHVYQAQCGVLNRIGEESGDDFLWQLFIEGVAMVFEQTLVGDPEFYHQDKNGWKRWMVVHLNELKQSFQADLKEMTGTNQRYFGDWVEFHGYGDSGYYLGAQFVRFILRSYPLSQAIAFDLPQIRELFAAFCAENITN